MTRSQEMMRKINALRNEVAQRIGHQYLLAEPIDEARDWSGAAFDLVDLIGKAYLMQQGSMENVTADNIVEYLVKQSRDDLLDLVNNQLPALSKEELDITDFPSYIKVLMAVSYPVYLDRCKKNGISTDKSVDQVMAMIESGKLVTE